MELVLELVKIYSRLFLVYFVQNVYIYIYTCLLAKKNFPPNIWNVVFRVAGRQNMAMFAQNRLPKLDSIIELVTGLDLFTLSKARNNQVIHPYYVNRFRYELDYLKDLIYLHGMRTLTIEQT